MSEAERYPGYVKAGQFAQAADYVGALLTLAIPAAISIGVGFSAGSAIGVPFANWVINGTGVDEGLTHMLNPSLPVDLNNPLYTQALETNRSYMRHLATWIPGIGTFFVLTPLTHKLITRS